MAYRTYNRRSRSSAGYRTRRSAGGGRRPGGRAVRRTGGRSRAGQQTVKIQLQIAAPPIGGTGLPSETQAEVKAARAKY